MKSFPPGIGVHDLGQASMVAVSKRNSATCWVRFGDYGPAVAAYTDRFEEAFGLKVEESPRGLPNALPERVVGALVVEVKMNDYNGSPVTWLKSFGSYNGDARRSGRPGSSASGPPKGNAEANVIARVLGACIEAGYTKETAVEWVDLGLAKLKESVR